MQHCTIINVKQEFSTHIIHYSVLIFEIPLFDILLVIQEFVLALYFLERFFTFLKQHVHLYLSVTSDSSLAISQTLHAMSTALLRNEKTPTQFLNRG